jgi:ABC-type branched-subunit amino acid transport system substrate-binding protein
VRSIRVAHLFRKARTFRARKRTVSASEARVIRALTLQRGSGSITPRDGRPAVALNFDRGRALEVVMRDSASPTWAPSDAAQHPRTRQPDPGRTATALRRLVGLLSLSGAALTVACGGPAADGEDEDAIVIGAVLPFTGEDATIGQNLEQAMLLAVEDINRAGGVSGRRLRLVSRDSNSGSERGLQALLELLYAKQVAYLIGPEENELANEVVPDIKALDVFNVLPGYASPSADRVGTRGGAWLRLPPSPRAWGCGLSELARENGVHAVNAVVAQDDFNQAIATQFASAFSGLGGELLSSTTLCPRQASYLDRAERALAAGAERTLLVVNPTMASTMITELAVENQRGSWMLGPTLHTPGFLENIPYRLLNGAKLVSPTLSLTSECEELPEAYRGPLECTHDNADAFRRHYEMRWDGDSPFPQAHFYYDAVVLLAMGLQYAAAQHMPKPRAYQLHAAVREMTDQATKRGRWKDLRAVFKTLAEGKPLGYAGAAAEYEFDQFGAAKHVIFNNWHVGKQAYIDDGTLRAPCNGTSARQTSL